LKQFDENSDKNLKRIIYCLSAYLTLNLFTAFVTVPAFDKCKFVNTINNLLAKFDSQQQAPAKTVTKKYTKIIKIVSAFVTGIELSSTIYMSSAMDVKGWSHISYWMAVFFLRMLLVIQEQWATLICTELHDRFSILNKNILRWRPEPTLFCKLAGVKGTFGETSSAGAQFSSLSLALQAVNNHFGIFWLLDIINLSALVLVLSSTLSLAEGAEALTYLVCMFMASLRLTLICLVCGDTSAQVNYLVSFKITLLIMVCACRRRKCPNPLDLL
jgi:hypothetical protein